MVEEQGIEKSETGEGAWTRSHASCFAGPLPLLEGAGSEFSAETYVGRMDRAIGQSWTCGTVPHECGGVSSSTMTLKREG